MVTTYVMNHRAAIYSVIVIILFDVKKNVKERVLFGINYIASTNQNIIEVLKIKTKLLTNNPKEGCLSP